MPVVPPVHFWVLCEACGTDIVVPPQPDPHDAWLRVIRTFFRSGLLPGSTFSAKAAPEPAPGPPGDVGPGRWLCDPCAAVPGSQGTEASPQSPTHEPTRPE
jgi:hypothetical protein